MVFNVGKIRTTLQQLGQKLTPDKIHQFGTEVRDTACVVDENFHESTVYEIYKFILKN